MTDGNWKPGDGCQRCLGHGHIEVAINEYEVCPVCDGEGTLKPIKNRAEPADNNQGEKP